MGQVFRRKQFSDYLGENRAILDIVSQYGPTFCSNFYLEYSAHPTLNGDYTQISGEKVTLLEIISPPNSPSYGPYFKKNGEDTYLFVNGAANIFQFYTGVTNTNFGVDLTSNKVPPTPNRVGVDPNILSSIGKTYPISGINIIPGFTADTSNIIYDNCPFIPPTPSPSPSSTPSPTPTPTPSPTPFSPSLTNMVYHYDFSSESNVSLRNSGGTDYVELAYDLSPNGYNLTTTGTTLEPIYTIDSFGNKCALFDGVDDILFYNIGSNITLTAFTGYLVFEFVGIAADNAQSVASSLGVNYLINKTNNRFQELSSLTYWDNFTGFTKNPNYLVVGKSDGQYTLNDQIPTSYGTTLGTYRGIYLGAFYNGSSGAIDFHSNVMVKEVIFYDTLLSDFENTQIIDYLKNKWDYSSW
jgi:hypothetical protein